MIRWHESGLPLANERGLIYGCRAMPLSLAAQSVFQTIVKDFCELVLLVFGSLKTICNIGADTEDALGKRWCRRDCLVVDVSFEIVEITAIVKYIELLLVLACAEDVGTEAGPPDQPSA